MSVAGRLVLLPAGGCGLGVASRAVRAVAILANSRSVHAAPVAAGDAAVKSYEDIPGPRPLPIIGNAWRFLPLIGEYSGLELDKMYRKLFDTYGPIVRFAGIPGKRDMVFLYRPEDVEVTFRNEGAWPHREGIQCMEYYRNVIRKDFYKDGGSVLTENGPKWLESRSKVNQPMMQPRISKKYVPPIADVAQEFVDKMRAMRNENYELPPTFVNEFFKWSLESIAFVALDARLGCLAPNLPPESEPQKFIDAVNTVIDKLFHLEVGLPFWKIFPTPSWNKFVSAQDMILEVSVKYINVAIDRVEKRKAAGEDEGDPSVLERLLARADPKRASIMAQDMLFAGIDTTSYSTAVAMYMLSKNKDKQEILFGELKRFLPNKDSPITEETLEEMKFLKACFKECSRIHPITSANLRRTVKDTVLSNYRVPEGVNVVMPNITFRESDDVFPQSKRFIPERWLKTRPSGEAAGSLEDFDAVSQSKKHHPFVFLPFGFGPRSCVGKRFAELEMEILLAKVVRNFHVDYKYGDMKFVSRIINTPQDPMRFTLTDRKEE